MKNKLTPVENVLKIIKLHFSKDKIYVPSKRMQFKFVRNYKNLKLNLLPFKMCGLWDCKQE